MSDPNRKSIIRVFSAAAGVMLLAIALFYSGWMMSHVMGRVFHQGYLGCNGARYSIMARNVLRADLAAVNYAPLLNAALDTDPDPYLHHPPLLHWVIALSFYCFGETEDHARYIPYAFTLLNLILLFFLGRRITGSTLSGGFCALMGGALPLTSFYGAHIDVQGSPLVCCILAGLFCYLRWVKSNRRRDLFLLLFFMGAGTLFDWPALYLCGLCPLHLWLERRKTGLTALRAVRSLWPLIATGAFLFAVLALWLSTAAEPKGPSLYESVLHRSMRPSTFLDIGDPWMYVSDQFMRLMPQVHSLCPWPFWLVMLAGGLASVMRRARPGRASISRVLWILFLMGFIHIVIFPFGSLFHDYWIFLLMPWMAIASGVGLWRLLRLYDDRSRVLRAGSLLVVLVLTGSMVFAASHYAFERFAGEKDIEPYLLGKRIHEHVAPGEAVMINANFYNAPIPGEGDQYVLYKPALSYYADRVIRGEIQTVERFKEVLARRKDFAYFIFITDYGKSHGELLDYLKQHYPMEKQVKPGLLFFRLSTLQ
ncbi:MAG: glycosyltransferase family 39 protein [Planctomycetota bacterium]